MNPIDKKLKIFPLTHPQKRIWVTEKIYPNTSLHNIGGTVRVKGNVDFGILEQSINILIMKNEALRIRIIEINVEAYQYVSEYTPKKLELFDFSSYQNPEKEFEGWVEREARKPIQLDAEELFYFAMFKVNRNLNGYFFKFHHIISDGWSYNIMTEQICDVYSRLSKGQAVNQDVEVSYLEYIDIEQKYLESQRFNRNKEFWNQNINEHNALNQNILNIAVCFDFRGA